ncbi:MAG TPA: immunoglobulin-like domain-containing protein, partial [Cellulomonas sp.]
MRNQPSPRTKAVGAIAGLAVLVGGLVAAPTPVAALEPSSLEDYTEAGSLLADFDFDDLTAGRTGTLSDTTGNATAVITGAGATGAGSDGSTAARISSQFWLKVTDADGASPLKGRHAVTISYDSRPDATGNLGWTVFATRDGAPAYQQEHYVGFLDKTDGLTVERYNSNGSRDSSGNVTGSSGADWKHVDLIVTDDFTTLYVDGVQVAHNESTSGRTLPEIVAANGGSFQVGKANWGSGEYYSGLIDNLRIYDSTVPAARDVLAGLTVERTVTEDFTVPVSTNGVAIEWTSANDALAVDGATGEVAVTRPAIGDADAEGRLTATLRLGGTVLDSVDFDVTVAHLPSDTDLVQAALEALSIENADDMRGNFSVPTTGAHGAAITWTVVDGGAAQPVIGDGVNVSTRTVTVKRPAAGSAATTVTLRAQVRIADETAEKDFDIVVQPMPAGDDETEAYVWAFFTGEGVGGEKISLAASKGNDALDWNTLNAGTPLFTSSLGEQGLRDPFILASHDGDKFYLLATDLRIAGRPVVNGLTGFRGAQANGSTYIEIWESTDLVNWSEQRHVKVSTDHAGNTWAPEAYWDDELGTYVVYWASNLYAGTDATSRTGLTYNRMMWATTDDFVSFSEPQVWIDSQR